ncbi:hypothetical protein QLX67_10605 [Balneolaceae bacterium ANBcel3]|nr:hypothetical protein [Balneolaceae bacterium ANBcel3]
MPNKKSNTNTFCFGLFLLMFALSSAAIVSCGKTEEKKEERQRSETRIHGTITVDPTLDDTRNYSGITLLIRHQQDTLFHAVTGREGTFDSRATFPERNTYILEVQRNRQRLADTMLVLAPDDAIFIEGMLPRFSGKAEISSYENDAMKTFVRMERQYSRAFTLAALGEVHQDSLPAFMQQWSGLFWQLFERYPETLAGSLAAQESFQMSYLDQDQSWMQRIYAYPENETIQLLAARYGFMAKLYADGLDEALVWLDSLEANIPFPEVRKQLARNRIEILYDSARTAEAYEYLEAFDRAFDTGTDLDMWRQALGYDIRYLAPGEPLPDFELPFFKDGERFTRTLEDLAGAPALIEVVSIAERSYRLDYQDLQTVYRMFEDQGLQFLTLPMEESQTLVNAFFEEWGQQWPVAEAGAYRSSTLETDWNVYEWPVRFLVDADGRIVRKFHGTPLNEIIIEINTLITNGEVL